MSATITAADLGKCGMRETMHGHGDKGMWTYEFTCIQHPRLTKRERCPQRGAPVEVYFLVDGVKVGNSLEAAAAALNQPHDLADCARRLGERYGERWQVVVLDGRLVVSGETAKRCERLRISCPAYEGVPIEWVASVDAGAPSECTA